MTDTMPAALPKAEGNHWTIWHGDCVPFATGLPEASLDFSIYSPPFSNLFVYSSRPEDMGNSANDAEFRERYGFLVQALFRATLPGRLTAVHCSDIPSTKWKDGEVGLRDFMGLVVQAHIDAGWILHARVTIWKDPVVEMTRTKALGLLYKQLKKDSGRSRVGMPDYLCVFRKPGVNPKPIVHQPEDFPVEKWQEWASPVWMTVNQTNTLNVQAARDEADERHICPLQLDVIDRALIMWSNPGDVVYSPFTGIGSEGYCAIKQGRKFIGTELKDSYFSRAAINLGVAEVEAGSKGLFDAA